MRYVRTPAELMAVFIFPPSRGGPPYIQIVTIKISRKRGQRTTQDGTQPDSPSGSLPPPSGSGPSVFLSCPLQLAAKTITSPYRCILPTYMNPSMRHDDPPVLNA